MIEGCCDVRDGEEKEERKEGVVKGIRREEEAGKRERQRDRKIYKKNYWSD